MTANSPPSPAPDASALVIPSPNAGETIRIARADDGYRVHRVIPRLGEMWPIATKTPWWFAYTPEAARAVLDWMASDA